MGDKKIKFTKTEMRSLKAKQTGVYLQDVMKKLFREKWERYLKGLLGGDRKTLDTCAEQLKQNLDFFPLLHTLCLVTGRKDDLDAEDAAKAADRWLTWYMENKANLVWDLDEERWMVGE